MSECPTQALVNRLFEDLKAEEEEYFSKKGEKIPDDADKNDWAHVNRYIKIMQREVILAQTFWDLEHLTFDSSDGTPPNFYEIAKANLKSTDYRTELDQWNGSCQGDGAVAFTNLLVEQRSCLLCDLFYSSKTNRFIRAMTLVHEARHRSKNDPNHCQCKDINI